MLFSLFFFALFHMFFFKQLEEKLYWTWVIVCHAQRDSRIKKAFSTCCRSLKICTVRMFACMDFVVCIGLQQLFILRNKESHKHRRFFTWQMEIITHCGAKLALGPLTGLPWCLHYALFPQSSSASSSAIVSPLLYINTKLAATGISFRCRLLPGGIAFDIDLSCRTWCWTTCNAERSCCKT